MSQTHEYSLKKDFADPLSKHHTPSGFSDNFDKKPKTGARHDLKPA